MEEADKNCDVLCKFLDPLASLVTSGSCLERLPGACNQSESKP